MLLIMRWRCSDFEKSEIKNSIGEKQIQNILTTHIFFTSILFPYSEHCIMTWTERGIYIFIPQNAQVLLWSEVKGKCGENCFYAHLKQCQWSFSVPIYPPPKVLSIYCMTNHNLVELCLLLWQGKATFVTFAVSLSVMCLPLSQSVCIVPVPDPFFFYLPQIA